MNALVENVEHTTYLRCRRKIDGNTWEFTCEGRIDYRKAPHPAITYIGRKENAPCPLCVALDEKREVERRMDDVARRIAAFGEIEAMVNERKGEAE